MLKASFHIHIDGDADDYIRYSGFELLDKAHELGFEVISFTCHQRVVITEELREHAKKLDILLIPGIELNLRGHVLVLNADRGAEQLKTLEDLERYRLERPDIFTIAAHPFFPHRRVCLQERLFANLHLFDAIEHSWFYSRLIDWNKKAKTMAAQHNLPYMATSDVHLLEQMENGHLLIDSDKNIESIFEALRNHQFESVAKPQGIFRMWWIFVKMNVTMAKKFLPWNPPHIPFEHDELPPEDQRKSEPRPETDRVSREF